MPGMGGVHGRHQAAQESARWAQADTVRGQDSGKRTCSLAMPGSAQRPRTQRPRAGQGLSPARPLPAARAQPRGSPEKAHAFSRPGRSPSGNPTAQVSTSCPGWRPRGHGQAGQTCCQVVQAVSGWGAPHRSRGGLGCQRRQKQEEHPTKHRERSPLLAASTGHRAQPPPCRTQARRPPPPSSQSLGRFATTATRAPPTGLLARLAAKASAPSARGSPLKPLTEPAAPGPPATSRPATYLPPASSRGLGSPSAAS